MSRILLPTYPVFSLRLHSYSLTFLERPQDVRLRDPLLLVALLVLHEGLLHSRGRRRAARRGSVGTHCAECPGRRALAGAARRQVEPRQRLDIFMGFQEEC